MMSSRSAPEARAHAGEHPEAAAGGPPPNAARLGHLVGYAASRAAIQMKKTFVKHLGPLQLKVVEFSVLVLVASNARINQKQLGQALDVSAPNLAVILDKLAERGLIQRVRSTEDRREQLIHLTPAGRALTQRAETIAATMETEALRALSDAERALLIELLMKVARGRASKR